MSGHDSQSRSVVDEALERVGDDRSDVEPDEPFGAECVGAPRIRIVVQLQLNLGRRIAELPVNSAAQVVIFEAVIFSYLIFIPCIFYVDVLSANAQPRLHLRKVVLRHI
jgi:hypothetical protein